jgi:hypothetical protein
MHDQFGFLLCTTVMLRHNNAGVNLFHLGMPVLAPGPDEDGIKRTPLRQAHAGFVGCGPLSPLLYLFRIERPITSHLVADFPSDGPRHTISYGVPHTRMSYSYLLDNRLVLLSLR